jgi:hypothetical protein
MSPGFSHISVQDDALLFLRNAPGKPDRRREEEEGKNYRERLKGEQCGKSKLTEQQKKAGLCCHSVRCHFCTRDKWYFVFGHQRRIRRKTVICQTLKTQTIVCQPETFYL